MISTDRSLYKETLQQVYLPIFFQTWYLDIVTDGRWTPYQLISDDGETKAIWISNPRRKLGISYSLGPELTPYTGLYTFDKKTNFDDLVTFVKSQFSFIEQPLSLTTSDLKVSNKAGVTYIIDGNNAENIVFANMKSSWRRNIRKASKIYQIKSISFEKYSETLQKSFVKKGKPNPFPMGLFRRIDQACETNSSRKILGAYDEDNNLCGVAYFMFDKKYTYYMGGGHIDVKNSMYLLLWEGIRDSLANGRNFDFEGSSIPGVAQFFKGFGGELHTYPIFQHSNSKLISLLVKLKKWWSR